MWGFRGNSSVLLSGCSLPGCPPGFHGTDCQQHCDCAHGAACDPATGHCHCPVGLRGHRCQEGLVPPNPPPPTVSQSRLAQPWCPCPVPKQAARRGRMGRDAGSAVTAWGTHPVTASRGTASVLREKPAPAVTQVRLSNEVSREMQRTWGVDQNTALRWVQTCLVGADVLWKSPFCFVRIPLER